MMAPAQHCNTNRIAEFVDADLSDHDVSVLEQHLADCETCRAELTEMTAAPELWAKAGQLLRDEDDDQMSLSSLIDGGGRVSQPMRSQEVLDLLDPSTAVQSLGRLNQYDIHEVIGAGGMGIVLDATDTQLNRTVAIKVMAPHLATSDAARTRFSREAKAAAALTHDHVIEVYGVSEFKQLPFLVMPFASGESLQHRVDTGGPMPIPDVVNIGQQIASGLAAAHEQGLVHRDIKPANILFNQEMNRWVITDFGLARAVDDGSLTRTGVIAGTPQYMSPEQAQGESVDVRSDLFSLGSLLYFVSTGRVPFPAESTYGVLRRISDTQPQNLQELNPNIPDWLATLINKLLQKKPSQRFQSASEVDSLLAECRVHLENRTTPLPRELLLTRRHFGKALAITGALAGTSLAAALVVYQRRPQKILLQGHNQGVCGVAIDRKSEIVATGSDDNLIRLFSVADGKLLKTIPGHNGNVNSVAFHPTEDRFVTAGLDGAVRVWKNKSTKPQFTFSGYNKRVNEAVFSPDGRWIAGATWSKTVEVWDAVTGEQVRTLYADSGRNSVSFSPDGRLIASGGWDRKTYIWDTKTFKRVTVLERHKNGVYQSCFSPNGKTLATASHDNTVLLWDVKTWTPKFVLENSDGPMFGVTFSPDGKRLATVGIGTEVTMWNPKNGKIIEKLPGHPKQINTIRFSPDGKSFVTGGYGRTAILWKNH